VDAKVGRRVRTARIAKNVSLTELGEAIGVSYQQVQKYEIGANRIGTGRLHQIAKALDTPMGFFFQETGKTGGKQSPLLNAASDALSTKEGMRIARALARMPSRSLQRTFARLMEAAVNL
jgi:transcriptional regulator with XRE-family HTH domain